MICFYQTTISKWTGLPEDELKRGIVIEIELQKPVGEYSEKRIRPVILGKMHRGHTDYSAVNLETGEVLRRGITSGKIPEWVFNPVVMAIMVEQFKKEKHESNQNDYWKSTRFEEAGSGAEKPEAHGSEARPEKPVEGPQVGKTGETMG